MALGDVIRKSRGSLYVQVAELLRRRIVNKTWTPGEKLPSFDKLAKEFSVAIVTVTQAIALLEEDGFVQRQQGRGTFVTDGAAVRDWVSLESTWQQMLRKWEKSSARVLRDEDAAGSPVLEPGDGTPAPSYRYLKRIHLSEDVPYALINIYVDRRLFALAPERFDKEMVILVLESLPNVELAEARQTLTIETADINVAQSLDIPVNSPVGEVRRVITNTDGIVIYVGEATYRGDLVRLETTLTPDR